MVSSRICGPGRQDVVLGVSGYQCLLCLGTVAAAAFPQPVGESGQSDPPAAIGGSGNRPRGAVAPSLNSRTRAREPGSVATRWRGTALLIELLAEHAQQLLYIPGPILYHAAEMERLTQKTPGSLPTRHRCARTCNQSAVRTRSAWTFGSSPPAVRI